MKGPFVRPKKPGIIKKIRHACYPRTTGGRMSKSHTVHVDNGKYTFVREALSIKVLRHGEPWHEQREAFNALASIMCELDAARVVLAAARSLEKRGEAPPALCQALRLHDMLVSDSEHPSEWAVPSTREVG